MRKRQDKAPVKISALFETYKKRLRPPQGSVVSAFIEVVEDVLGVTLKPSQCVYSPHSKILRIEGGGPLKTEIFLRKKEILTHLKGRLGAEFTPKELI